MFEKLLGGAYVKAAMAELVKSDRGDDADSAKLSELPFGRSFRGMCDLQTNKIVITFGIFISNIPVVGLDLIVIELIHLGGEYVSLFNWIPRQKEESLSFAKNHMNDM